MKGIKVLKLECIIGLQKFFLNLMLFGFSPTNRLVLMISKNLDKHIALQQKYIFMEYCLKSVEKVVCYNDLISN